MKFEGILNSFLNKEEISNMNRTKEGEYYKKWVLLLIFIFSLIRLFIAFNSELGNDEVYYWTYCKHLQWNYFDHPPMVALFIRIFTLNLHLEQFEGFLRLGSMVSAAISTYLIYNLTNKIHSPQAGFIAACLYTASIYSSVISGIMVMPDSSQMLFWTLSLSCLFSIFSGDHLWTSWIGFGIASGLCILSKVHGVFLWIGLIAFILKYKRNWLWDGKIYFSILLTIFIVSPILIWNFYHHFITYQFHSQRVSFNLLNINYISFFREVLGEIFYINPVIYLLILGSEFRRKSKDILDIGQGTLRLFNWIGLSMISTFLLISLFRETLPHWSGPGFITLMPFTAISMAQWKNSILIKRSLIGALSILVLFLLMTWAIIEFYPGTIKLNKDFDDISLDLYGWKDAGVQFGKKITLQKSKENIRETCPLVINKWFPGAHFSYYFCRANKIPIIGLGDLFDLHQFYWYNTFQIKEGMNPDPNIAFTIVPSNMPLDVQKVYGKYYHNIYCFDSIPSYRGSYFTGKALVRYFYLYELRGWKGSIPRFKEESFGDFKRWLGIYGSWL